MNKRAAIYLRVSTGVQSTENQRYELEDIARKSGWSIVETYEDKAVSGAKSRTERPAFDRLCTDATKRKFDVVMVWSVDRLGRSLQDLVGFLNELRALNVDLFIQKQEVDTTTPGGKALFQMLGVFAEFEREIIRERIHAGLDRARIEGKALGRPSLTNKIKGQVIEAKQEGLSVRKIATQVGISIGSVHNILQAETT